MASGYAPVPPIPSATVLHFLLEVLLLLALALFLGRVAVWLKGVAIVGELLAGVILGPSVLGHLAPRVQAYLIPTGAGQLHLVDALAQIAVVLLVAVTSAEVDAEVLRRYLGTAARIGGADLILPLAAGIAVAYAVPASFVPASTSRGAFALLLGVAMAASAIPVIAKTLADLKLLHRNVGQLILCACVMDDAVAWFLLSLVAAVATTSVQAGRVAVAIGALAGFVLLAFGVLRPLVHRWLQRVAATPARSSTGVIVVIIVACATATQALGMEAVFGAFIGGVVVGWSGTAGRSALIPLRTVVMTVFAPIFLATAGLRVDLTLLGHWNVLLWAAGLLAIATTSKFVAAYLGGRVSRLNHWESTAVGAGMNSRGVVEIVIAAVGLRLGVLNTTTYTIIVLIALATSVMTPPLLRLAMTRVEIKAEEELRLAAGAALTEGGQAAHDRVPPPAGFRRIDHTD